MNGLDKRATLVARERFRAHSGTVPEGVRPEIAESWIRCLDSYDVDAERSIAEVLPLADPQTEFSEFLELNTALFESFEGQVTASEHLLLVSDHDGRLVRSSGPAWLQNAAADRNIIPGSGWSEEVAGTNGIGSAIAEHAAFQVSFAEHLCRGWQDLACTGAPIIHPVTGAIAGVFDVTGMEAPSSHTLAFVTTSARLIEREWAAFLSARARSVASVYATHDAAAKRQPFLAFDRWGHLVEANRTGCVLAGISSEDFGRSNLPMAGLPAVRKILAEAAKHLEAAGAAKMQTELPLYGSGAGVSVNLIGAFSAGRLAGLVAIVDSQATGAPPDVAAAASGRRLQRAATRIIGVADGRMTVLDVRSIVYANTDEQGVRLHTADATFLSTYRTLASLTAAIPAGLFFQANRSEIVNLSYVREISTTFGDTLDLVLQDKNRTSIVVSRRRSAELRETLHF